MARSPAHRACGDVPRAAKRGPPIVQTTLLSLRRSWPRPASASWGSVRAPTRRAGVYVRDAQLSIDRTIWPAIPPGLAVFTTVVAFNVFGDGLRDAFAREARGGRIGIGDVQPRTDTSRGGESAPSGAAPGPSSSSGLLTVRDLSVAFPRPGTDDDVDVVSQVDLDIGRGEVVALVGESGSGKSITALSIMGLVPDPGARPPPPSRSMARSSSGCPSSNSAGSEGPRSA